MKNLSSLALGLLLLSCTASPSIGVDPANFKSVVDNKEVSLYTLTNKQGITMQVTNFGARVVTLYTPNREGELDDIVLGYESIDRYLHNTGERFLGATIGRYGNRIADGKFTLDGVDYQLSTYNNGQCLHGGDKGFDMVVWDVDSVTTDAIYFSYASPDGEEGFPGELRLNMSYKLTADNAFEVVHRATTDKATPVNLTHHSFFNFKSEGCGEITDHILMINADSITPTNSVQIPTGEVLAVEGTPFDFTTPTAIGLRIEEDDEQLKMGLGYDHNFVLNRNSCNELELAASVYEPSTGRYMEVWTTEPAIQLYSGNFFDGTVRGKGEKMHGYRGSFALETQHYPDAPNQAQFPSTILHPDEVYNHTCVYKFSVK